LDGWVKFLGHATLLMRLGDLTILTDPIAEVLKGYPGLESSFSLDLVAISHGHRDHLDFEALVRLKPSVILAPQGYRPLFPKGLTGSLVEIRRWESVNFKDVRITALPSLHLGLLCNFPFLFPTLGYIFEHGDLGVYFAGDTGFSAKLFKEIGERFKIDVAFLPIGSDRFLLRLHHLGAETALRASELLKARVFIPIHWGVVKSASGDPLRILQKLSTMSFRTLRLLNLGERSSWEELLRGGAKTPPLKFP